MTFLFFSALLALPLAGLPVLLHLLFRRKTPVMPFSTLRFVKAAIQHTAARRKVQRWLLLACRMLLLAILIVAVAQPAKQVASAWMSSGDATVAVIVVDTSYSMLLQEDRAGSGATATLLNHAESELGEFLNSDLLKNARVAILRSSPPADGKPEPFQSVAAIRQNLNGLKPQPSPLPLARRVDKAIQLLAADPAPQKWLLVISDVQAKEFTQPLQIPPEIKTALIYLTPAEPRSAGITAVGLDPEDPIPGIGAEVSVEVAGRAGDSRAVAVSVYKIGALETPLLNKPAQIASFGAGGRSQVRFPVRLPAERFMLVKGALQVPDSLPWDNERLQLIEVPSKQPVTLLEPQASPANKFLRLALDPTGGAEWPLAVSQSATLSGSEAVAAINLAQWPDAALASRLRDFAKTGGTLILCLQPGLEETFKTLAPEIRGPMLEMLPSAPTVPPINGGAYRAAPGSIDDPLLKGLTDKKFDIAGIVVRRFVPILVPEGPAVQTILQIAPINPGPGARPYPLLSRRKLGAGMVYTLATLPDPRFTNLPTHPLFLPIVVRMSLRSAGQREVQNVELGEPLTLSGPRFKDTGDLLMESPDGATYVVKPSEGPRGRQHLFAQAQSPGLYTWRDPATKNVVALGNVQYPSSEADLTYKPAKTVLPPSQTHFAAISVNEFLSQKNTVTEPQPRWALPICVVLCLLCVEAMMGSSSRAWKSGRSTIKAT